MTRYVRRRTGRREDVTAALTSGILAAGVGLVSFYLTRLFLSREAVPSVEGRETEARALDERAPADRPARTE